MKRLLALLVALLAGAPVVAQESRLYTNADVGTKPVAWTRTVTPEELRGLVARQFVLPRELPDGPTVIIVSQRVEPQPLPPVRPLSEPWSMTTYVGRGFGRGFSRPPGGHGGAHVVRPGIHLRYP